VQRSTGFVLGGNHTLQAAQKLKWAAVDVTYLDVDDDAARKIVVADNRTSDLGGYDDRALVQLLRELGDEGLEGTGYDLDDYDELLAALQEADDDDPPQEPTVLVPVGEVVAPPSAGTVVRQTPTYEEYREAYASGPSRFLAFTYPPARYAWVVEKLEKVTADRGLPSHADALLDLLSAAYGEVPPAADATVSDELLAAAERIVEGVPTAPPRAVTVTDAVIPTEAAVAATSEAL